MNIKIEPVVLWRIQLFDNGNEFFKTGKTLLKTIENIPTKEDAETLAEQWKGRRDPDYQLNIQDAIISPMAVIPNVSVVNHE